jgi:hypothetical protein
VSDRAPFSRLFRGGTPMDKVAAIAGADSTETSKYEYDGG